MASLGNFMVNLVLARSLPPAEYGTFSLVFGVAWYVNNVYSTLVVYPLVVSGAGASAARLRELTEQALVLGVLALVPLSCLLTLAAVFTGRPELGPPAALAVVLWQLQETIRRALHAHLRYRATLVGDTLSYLGQSVLVLLLAILGQLTVELAFLAVAVTSAVAGVLQAWQLRLSVPTVAGVRESAMRSWALGRWPLLGFLANGTATLSFPWILAYTTGPAAVGSYQAASYLVNITNPLVLGTSSILTPATARTHHNRGVKAAVSVGLGVTLRTGMALGVYLAAIAIWPEVGLSVLYGEHSPYVQIGWFVRALALMWLFNYVSSMLITLLQAVRENRAAFLSTLSGAVAMMVFGPPLILLQGLMGAGLALVIAYLIKTIVAAFFVQRMRAAPDFRQSTDNSPGVPAQAPN